MVFKGRAGDALEGSPMNAQNKHAYCVEELWRSLVDEGRFVCSAAEYRNPSHSRYRDAAAGEARWSRLNLEMKDRKGKHAAHRTLRWTRNTEST